ncbi:MAG: hypothetical protein U0V02_07175 [Anaerolineales bacterium]
MKKIILSITLFFLISCQSAPDSNPPNVPISTKTVIPATSTITIEPTITPAPPTATTESFQDYVQASENVFPLDGLEFGLAEFICNADFDKIIAKNYTTPDGTITKLWVSCEDGGQTFITNLFIDSDVSIYQPMASAAAPKDGKKFQFADDSALIFVEKGLKILGVSGNTKIKIVGGNNSESLLRFGDPFPSIFSTVNWDEAFIEFAKTGNYTLLPKVQGLSGYLLYAIRIEVIK